MPVGFAASQGQQGQLPQQQGLAPPLSAAPSRALSAKKNPSLPLLPLGEGAGQVSQQQFRLQQRQQQQLQLQQLQQQQGRGGDALDERSRQLEQTLLSINDEVDHQQPPPQQQQQSPSPAIQQQHQEQFQWPGTVLAPFPNPGGADSEGYQHTPQGLGQPQQRPRGSLAGAAIAGTMPPGTVGAGVGDSRQQMDESWRRQQQGVPAPLGLSRSHGRVGGVQGRTQLGQAQGQAQDFDARNQFVAAAASPVVGVVDAGSVMPDAYAGRAGAQQPGSLSPPGQHDQHGRQRQFRQRQYQQLAQLTQIQQQQQHQQQRLGIDQGGPSTPAMAAAASGYRPPQAAEGAVLQAEWARRSQGQAQAGAISAPGLLPPSQHLRPVGGVEQLGGQAGGAVGGGRGGGGQRAGLAGDAIERSLSRTGEEELPGQLYGGDSQHRQQQQQQHNIAAPAYTEWQSQGERRQPGAS